MYKCQYNKVISKNKKVSNKTHMISYHIPQMNCPGNQNLNELAHLLQQYYSNWREVNDLG